MIKVSPYQVCTQFIFEPDQVHQRLRAQHAASICCVQRAQYAEQHMLGNIAVIPMPQDIKVGTAPQKRQDFPVSDISAGRDVVKLSVLIQSDLVASAQEHVPTPT